MVIVEGLIRGEAFHVSEGNGSELGREPTDDGAGRGRRISGCKVREVGSKLHVVQTAWRK